MDSGVKIEVLLFVSGEEGLTISELSNLLELSSTACQQQIEKLNEKYNADATSALTIIHTAGKWRLTTKEIYADFLKSYAKTTINRSLSTAAIEVLSIIAYKQPITRIEIDQLRTLSSSSVLSTLRAFGLIEVTGQLEAPGRPSLYATTDFFLDYIGIDSLKQLPSLEDREGFEVENTILFKEDNNDNDNENQ